MRVLPTIVMGCLLAAASPAQAKDMGDRFGIGADSSLGFFTNTNIDPTLFPDGSAGALKLPGLSLVYRATKIFGIQLIFSTALTSDETDLGPTTVQSTSTDIGVSLRGHIGVGVSKAVNLDSVIGVTYINQGASTNDTQTYSANDIAIELGIRPEWFVSEHLSIHTQVGVAVSILNDDVLGVSNGGVNVQIFGPSDLLGNAGFTFYF